MKDRVVDEIEVDHEHLRAITAKSVAAGRRLARKAPLVGLAFVGFLAVIIAVAVATKARGDDHEALTILGAVCLGMGIPMFVGLRMLFMRDVHQIERLIEHGVPHRGQITSRVFIVGSLVDSGPSNMTVSWKERGHEVTAQMNDRGDVLDGPVKRDVVVLTRRRKRWVGVVVGDKLLLALRPPREYHLWGEH